MYLVNFFKEDKTEMFPSADRDIPYRLLNAVHVR